MFFEVPRSSESPVQPSSAFHDPNIKKRKLDAQVDGGIAFPVRTSKACDRCRVKKTRCLPDENSCKKCRQEGAICTFAEESKPDTKARSSPAYVQMLEGERRILMQALRELSKAKGDISVLNPTLRTAIGRMQVGGNLDDFAAQQMPRQAHDESPPKVDKLSPVEGHLPISSSDHSQNTSTPNTPSSNGLHPTNMPNIVDEQSMPQYSLVESTLATFPDWNFDDYPLQDYFSFPDDFSYTGIQS